MTKNERGAAIVGAAITVTAALVLGGAACNRTPGPPIPNVTPGAPCPTVTGRVGTDRTGQNYVCARDVLEPHAWRWRRA